MYGPCDVACVLSVGYVLLCTCGNAATAHTSTERPQHAQKIWSVCVYGVPDVLHCFYTFTQTTHYRVYSAHLFAQHTQNLISHIK